MAQPPSGFHKWPWTHFHCPYCGHSGHAFYADRGRHRRYWCEKCGHLSTLKAAVFISMLWGLCIPVVYFSVLLLIVHGPLKLSGLGTAGEFWVALVLTMPLMFLVVWPVFSRFTHEYEPAN